jgi:hypothetical protein
VEIEFPHGEVMPVLRDGSAVDLELRGANGATRCARTLLARDPDAPLEAKPTFSFAGKLRVHVPTTSVYNTSSATTLGLALGRWAGPMYFDVSAGFAFGFCRDCPEGQNGLLGLPLALEAKNYPIQGGGYALGWSVGYLGIPALFPDHTLWIHAPRASLSFALSPPAPSGFPTNVRSEVLGLELFGERWIYRLSGSTEQATVLGLGFFFAGAM